MKLRVNLSSLSAVPLSLVRPYLKEGWNRGRYKKIFEQHGSGIPGKRYRIYLPLSQSKTVEDVAVPSAIQNYLATKNISVDNYVLGLGRLPDGRATKLGRVLNTEPDLKRMFDADPQRRGTAATVKALVVISRHPYDILGMSFDRGWTSCMDVREGMNRSYLQGEIDGGSLVAYLVKDDDKNINRPIARILLRPHVNAVHHILVPGPVYGTAPPAFMRTIVNFCNTVLNAGRPGGKYKLPDTSYDDNPSESLKPEILHLPADDTTDISVLAVSRKIMLARNPLVAPAVLDALSVDPSASVRLRVARNLNVSASTLKLLATDKSTKVRTYVAANSSLGPDIMEILARDKSIEVRASLASNTGITTSAAAYLATSTDVRILNALAMNPSMSPAVLAILATAGSPDVKAEVAYAVRATPEILTTLSKDFVFTVRRAVAGRSDTPQEILDQLLTDSDFRVRHRLALRDGLTDKMLMVLMNDHDEDVRKTLARSSTITTNQWHILYKSKYLDVRLGLVNRVGTTGSDLPISVLEDLSTDKSKTVRRAILDKCQVLLKSSIDPLSMKVVVERLVQDQDPAIVRGAVALIAQYWIPQPTTVI